MSHGYFSKQINPDSNSDKWRKCNKRNTYFPFSLASITTEPVARTTAMNVPITSAKKHFWLGVNPFVIFANSVFCFNLRVHTRKHNQASNQIT